MSEPADVGYPERFRFESEELGLRLWREPGRRMTLEPIIRSGQTHWWNEWEYHRGPDTLIGYWVKFEGLFPKRLDELVGETTSFGFQMDRDGELWRWHFESVTWLEGWDQDEQRPCIAGHAEPHEGPSKHPYVRDQLGEQEASIAAWWREPTT